MTHTKTFRNRRGFSLVETLVAMILFVLVLGTTLSVMDDQVRAMTGGVAEVRATQYLRFAFGLLERELPFTGSNAAAHQPFLVYADSMTLAFNADLVSDQANDPSAVYSDTLAPAAAVWEVQQANKFTIPGTGWAYPDTTYRVGGILSPAETIVYVFRADSSTSRTDDYVLYRKVNHLAPEMVARNLLKVQGQPFFRFYRHIVPASGLPYLLEVPKDSLPLRHTQPVHLAATDTGKLAKIDRIRAVRVAFRTTDERPGSKERIYSAARTITLPNAGITAKKTCGDEPIIGNNSFSSAWGVVDTDTVVQLTWNPAVDETAGEEDVIRYVLWRSTAGSAGAGDPYLSIPSGAGSYAYTDALVNPGTTYYYALGVQDCSPSMSTLKHTVVVIP